LYTKRQHSFFLLFRKKKKESFFFLENGLASTEDTQDICRVPFPRVCDCLSIFCYATCVGLYTANNAFFKAVFLLFFFGFHKKKKEKQ
jgi:hypothetical protein